MSKKNIFLLTFFAVILISALLFFLRSNEDTWLCQNGNWVKHGNPSLPQPTSGCSEINVNNNNIALTNPASQHCLARGGQLEIKKDEQNGEYGVCQFSDGSECEEWQFFRGECQLGIQVSSPARAAQVTSPLEITGQAQGNWFFEGSFPVKLIDKNEQLIAAGIVQAQSDWMTEDFVPFKGSLEFITTAEDGYLVLSKDNPSGLPENDLSIKIPISFTKSETIILKVYFNNNKLDPEISCNKVFSVDRQVPKTVEVARAALLELLKGPNAPEKENGYTTSINEGVVLHNVTINDGVALAEFDEKLDKAVGGSCRVSSIRAQITETLKQFSGVKEVIISINGRSEDILQP